MTPACPLCGETGNLFFESPGMEFNKCDNCFGIYASPSFLPDAKTEIDRYQTHNNDVNDIHYQNFISPIVTSVLKDFSTEAHTGLDYGAGTGPVITKKLRDCNFEIFPYDPFFSDDKELLERKYNFIVCCEVMEHFHHPEKEFKRLKDLLLPGGKLYCMTHLYAREIDFPGWYYKNDPTHVFIYQKETLDYIVQKLGFSGVEINKRLIIFSSQERKTNS
ncbi:methyltransferase [Salinimicrobium marinum]|uniref:Methyltransferase n=1 Tax=Salinimicrobium marinum TaxID=680283 RepID=A0A918S834_9FLAO|nr:class I SAM-dependent methyltransferase [Salinimicrobium marinum]GHA25835.1 methyltransferase [Salinimicrobium marinum]